MSSEQRAIRELLARIETSWAALQQAIAAATPARLETVTDPGGWSIKDHLAHLAAWERVAVGLLQGSAPSDVLDLAGASVDPRDFDAINAALQQRMTARPAEEILAESRASHQSLLAILATLSDADLGRPYADFRPGEIENEAQPIVGWITGDTYEHYDEHLATITALLAAAPR